MTFEILLFISSVKQLMHVTIYIYTVFKFRFNFYLLYIDLFIYKKIIILWGKLIVKDHAKTISIHTEIGLTSHSNYTKDKLIKTFKAVNLKKQLVINISLLHSFMATTANV